MRWPGFILFLIALWLFTRLSKGTNRPTKPTTTSKSDLFTSLVEKLEGVGFNSTMAAFIAAQSAFETANFTSELFKKNNNLFGMTNASGRENRQIKVDNYGFGVYSTLADSITDFKIYYDLRNYWYSYGSIESYIKALKQNNYFTAPLDEYTAGVKYYYNLYYGE